MPQIQTLIDTNALGKEIIRQIKRKPQAMYDILQDTELSEQNLRKIAYELRRELIREWGEEVSVGSKTINTYPLKYQYVVNGSDISVSFDITDLGLALRRNSLRGARRSLGDGVYDIFGLFAKGWSYESERHWGGMWTKHRVFAYALQEREGSDFALRAAETIMEKYDFVNVIIPPEWTP